jgi:glycosyltransferase involved in cell wall biosynthesis
VANRSHLDLSIRYPEFVEQTKNEIAQLKREFNPDITIVRGTMAAAILDKEPNCYLVADLVDSLELLYRRQAHATKSLTKKLSLYLESIALGRLQASIATRTDLTLLVSQADADSVKLRAPSARIEVVSNGIDTEYFQPSSVKKTSVNILFFGVLDYPPNTEAARFLLEEIFPLVKRRIPQATLTIAGPNPPSSVRKLAGPDVSIPGYVKDLRPLMEGAAVFVCPMKSGTGIKNKILAAMSMGLPIVATRLAVQGILCNLESDLLLADTADELDIQIRRVLTDPTLAKKLSVQSRLVIERSYSWDSVVQSLEMVFSSLQSRDCSLHLS